MSFDLIISAGSLHDGLGKPPVRADLGVSGGRIRAIGDLKGEQATRRVDAQGLATCPGFLDTHGHSDLAIMVNPSVESQVAQGITTEVFGHCGMSPYPLSAKSAKYIFHYPKEYAAGRPPFDWYGPAEYFSKVRKRGIGLNLVPLMGHLTARADVVGDDDRPLKPGELDQLLARMREGFAAGCRGMTSGVSYPPTKSASVEELAACAGLIHEYPGAAAYTAHIRDQEDHVDEALEEFLAAGQKADVHVHVSHFGVGWQANYGKTPRILGELGALRDQGRRLTVDTLPYPTKGPFWGPRAVLPEEFYTHVKPWRMQAIALQMHLADQQAFEDLVARLEREPVNAVALSWGTQPAEIWDAIHIENAISERGRSLLGLSMTEAAQRLGGKGRLTPARLFVELLSSDGPDLSTVIINTLEADEEAIIRCPFVSFGTDSIGTRAEDVGSPLELMQAHPRMYGTFPRVLGHYARDLGLIPMEEAIRRMTSLPAAIFGLRERGVLREGAWADLVVFDPAAIREGGTFLAPRAYPKGIKAVFVNGTAVLEDGLFTSALPGRLLTRNVE